MTRKLIAALAICASAFAASARPGPDSNYNISVSTSSYTGPGDLQAFTFWCGFRAYSAATAGTKAIRVIRASDSTQQDINTLADGSLDAATLTTFLTSTTGKLVTCYDKVGTNDMTQATDANRPAITASALNTSYGATFNGTSTRITTSSAMGTVAQPYSFAMIVKPPAAADQGFANIDTGSFTGVVVEYKVAGNIRLFAGASLDRAISASTWHAVQLVTNGASSVNNLDGSETTGNAGAQSTNNTTMDFGIEGGGSFYSGLMLEFGFVAGTIASGTRTSLNTNMHAAYGGF